MTGTLELQGTPPLTIPEGAEAGYVWTTPDGSGNGAWQASSSDALGDVTVSGTPTQGEALIATGTTTASWRGVFGTRPEWFGSISGTTGDDVAILAAIAAVQDNKPGCPGPVVITQPCAISNTITAVAGVNLACQGQGNRQNFPDTFTGGFLFPAPNMATGTALITIGSTAANSTQAAANPCGIILDKLNLSGLLASGSDLTGCIGVSVTDTADVYMGRCFLANFDRPGGTGTCVQLVSGTAGYGVGFETEGCIFSSSQRGVYAAGAGVTDLRIKGGLFHGLTQGLTLGGTVGSVSGGGGGLQLNSAVHFTYTGMPSTGWHLSLGSQSGDFNIQTIYFDQAGSAVTVQLATAKGILSSNHWLAASSSTATSLVKLSTSGSQELTFNGNDCDANAGSTIKALLQFSAHSGNPTGGIYIGNSIYNYNTGTPPTAVIIDSADSAVADFTTAGVGNPYIAGNRVFS